jgi:hypothetical protein
MFDASLIFIFYICQSVFCGLNNLFWNFSESICCNTHFENSAKFFNVKIGNNFDRLEHLTLHSGFSVLFFYLSCNLFECLCLFSVCIFVSFQFFSVWLLACLSVCQFVLGVCLYVCLSVGLFVCLFLVRLKCICKR